jgi:hypothetical protein
VNHGRLAVAPVHHLLVMVSHVRVRPWLAARGGSGAPRQRPPVTSGIESWGAAGPAAGKSALLAGKGSGLGWAVSGMGAHMGAHCAPQCSALLQAAPPCALLTCAGGRQCRPRLCGCIPGGQGVAGSNPAVPTGSEVFSKISTSHQSQQKSHPNVKWPFQRHSPIMCPGLLPGHLSNRQSQRNQQSRGQRSLSHLRSAQRPRQLRTGEHHPGAPAHRKPDAHRAAAAAGRGQARTLTLGRPATSDAMAAGMRSAFGRTTTTVANPVFSRVWRVSVRLDREVLLNWDDKGCRDPFPPRFEEHFLRERYRMVARS